jgi:hypothetical protein
MENGVNRRLPMAPRDSARANLLVALVALAAALATLPGCTTTNGRVEVSSSPAGARILIDGADSGQQTPSSLVLPTAKKKYTIGIERSGFNPVVREVELAKDFDVMGPEEAVGRICISPCCCGLPLLKFLHPVDIDTKFVPSRIDATLEIAGQGARLDVKPSPFEAYLDGKLVALLEGNYLVTTVGDHELQIRSADCRPYSRSIHVDERVYQRISVELEAEGQGLLVDGSPAGAKVYLDDQYQGNLGAGKRRVRAEPGPHMLRVDLDGYRPWQDVVQVERDRYQDVVIDLQLEGQGIRVRKPEGIDVKTPEIQVLVDGKLQGSAFDEPVRMEPGDHEVEIRVSGRDARIVKVHVTKDSWIDLEPGTKSGRNGKPQVQLDQQGIRIIEPEDLDEDFGPADITILVDGTMRAQAFGRIIPLEPGDYDVEVRVTHHEPWRQRVRVTRKQVLDVWPALKEK